MLKVTKGTGLEGLEDAYIRAEKEFGVNSIFLLSLTAHESWWGKSNRAINQNNLTGFNVTSDSAAGTNFQSKEQSILSTGKMLGKEYLTSGGLFYTGGKDIYRVNSIYCPVGGDSWSRSIVEIANDCVKKINRK